MKRSAAFSRSESNQHQKGKVQNEVINNYMSLRFDRGSTSQIEEEQDQDNSNVSSEVSDQKNFFVGQKMLIEKSDPLATSLDHIASMSKRRTESFAVYKDDEESMQRG
jgi:hypothetical protein|tara:strand:+ start:310 stop:633 length:324 start_codon:yes stop_codon:yes gene_type:complete